MTSDVSKNHKEFKYSTVEKRCYPYVTRESEVRHPESRVFTHLQKVIVYGRKAVHSHDRV